MKWDLIFQFSCHNVKHVLIPSDDSMLIKVHLVKKDNAPCLCHKCGSPMKSIRGHKKYQVEDLPMLEFKTQLRFRRLQGRCPNCRKKRLEAIDFLSPQNPKMTTRLAFLMYKLCEVAPVSRIAEIIDRPKTSLWRNDLRLLQGQVENYEIPILKCISVDEVYARAHHDDSENHYDRFFTIITCLKTRKVVWVEESRHKVALDRFFKKIGKEKCSLIEAVATDEHEGYISSVKEFCPNAINILDRFHLMRHFEEAVNDTRKLLYKTSDKKSVRSLAKGRYRFIFLKRAAERSLEERTHIEEVAKDNEMFIYLELIKENMLSMFDADTEEEALSIFLDIENWAKECGFPPIKAFCRKFRKKWVYIANYFMCKISTGPSEGMNNAIKALKRRAFGFKNMEYFRLKIMQVCGLLSSRYMDLNGAWTYAGEQLITHGRN